MTTSIGQRRLLYTAIVALAIYTGVDLRRSAFDEGFASDDYLHYAMLEEVYPAKRSPIDLFNFYRSAEEVKTLKAFGTLPWSTDPNFRLAMLRPLSSALIAFDYLAFGNNVRAFHYHSALWWALLIIAVALLLGEILPMPMAALAVLLFAVDESHDFPFVWLANRNALVSIGLGALGLWAHIRRRRRGRPGACVLSVAMFALALLAGEWVFAIFAYLFAFELLAKDKSLRRRMLELAPAALLGACFLIAQSLLGYGARNSSVYVSPLSDPFLFVEKAAQRIPVFFADMVLGIPTLWWHIETPWRQLVLSLHIFTPEVWRQLPGWKFWHVLLGIVAIVGVIPLIRWGMRKQEPEVRRVLRWLLLGALLSLVPMVSSILSERLTLPAAIGFSAVFSMLILKAAGQFYRSVKLDPPRPSFGALLVLLGGLWFQLYHAAERSSLEVQVHRYLYDSVAAWIEQAEIDDAKVARQRIVIVSTVEHTTGVFLPFVRYALGHPLPRSCWTLSGSPHAHDILRPAPNVLEIAVLGGAFMGEGVENFYRDDRLAFVPGETTKIDGLKIEIVAVKEGKPSRVRFTFDKPLEDPDYLFLYSSPDGMRRIELPKVGEKKRLARAYFPDRALLPYSKITIREPTRIRERWREFLKSL